MPTSGVDYPSKRGTDVMVGVPATNNTTWDATAEQITFRQGTTWYALFFTRSFLSYDDATKKYSYVDSGWYGVEIGTVGQKGATASSPPSGARNTSYGPRYDNLIEEVGRNAKRVKISTSTDLRNYGLTRPGTVPPLRQSPVDLGWSPSEGAASRKEGWDPFAQVPAGSREPGQTGTVDNPDGGSNDSSTETPEPVQISVKGPPRFNPPLISYASGAWTPRLREKDEDGFRPVETVPGDRSRILGPDQDERRVNQRGVLIQDLTHSQDWVYRAEDTPEAKDASRTTWLEQEADVIFDDDENRTWLEREADRASRPNPEEDRWEKDQSALENGIPYGFRFHYNPSTISMGVGITDEVNPSMIISGRETWKPVGALRNLGTVSLTLYLNRIEDMGFFRKVGTSYQWASQTPIENAYSGRRPNDKEIEGIMTRGTEYDLEFLFRTILGRPFPTALRGRTANLGTIWGTPCQLWLSASMRFTGRVEGIQWSHRSFNRWMVPMWTEVNLQFVRFPDALSAKDAPTSNGIGFLDGYTYDTVMGYPVFDRQNLGSEPSRTRRNR